MLARTYDAGGYTERVNYTAPCLPALAPEDQAWADGLIHQALGDPGAVVEAG